MLYSNSSANFSFFLYLVGLPFVVVSLFFIEPLTQFEFFLFLIKASMFSVAYFLYNFGIQQMELSFAAPLRNLSPLLVFFISFIFFNEKITIFNFLGSALIILSLIALNTYYPKWTNSKFLIYKFLVFWILPFTIFAITTSIDRVLAKNSGIVGGLRILSYHWIFSFIFLFFVLFFKRKIDLKPTKDKVRSAVYYIGDIFYFPVMSFAPAMIVSSVKNLRTLIATISGGIFFKEKGIFLKVILSTIILCGLFLISS